MADLYFKVSSDWQEVVRLREEITRLENQLNQFNGKAPLEVLNKLCDELVDAKARLQALVDDAAIAGDKMQEAFKKGTVIDLSTPEGQLKAFDATAEKFFENFSSNLSVLRDGVKELINALGASNDALANIQATEKNAAEIERIKKENEELRDELTRQSEELQKQIILYQQLQSTIAGNNAARMAGDSQIQSEINTTNAQVVAQGEVTDAVEQTTQALHDQADAADNVKQKMDEIESPSLGDGENGFYTQTLERDIDIAKEKIDELRDKMGELDATDAEGIAAIESRIAAYQSEIDEKTAKLEEMRTGIRASSEDVGNLAGAVVSGYTVMADGASEMMNVYAESQEKAQALADRIQISFENIPSMVEQASSAISELKGFDNLTKSEEEAIAKAERLAAKVQEIGSAQEMLTSGMTNQNFKDVAGLEDTVDKLNNMIRLKQESVELEKKEAEEAKNTAAAHQSIRTQIMNARNELVQMIEAGKMGTPEFQAAAEQAGELRKQMELANAYMQYFANPNRRLAAMKTGLQGVAGSMSLVTGAMGLFNTKSEKMAEIQTKLQSLMGIIIGLETTFATVKKTSNVMMAIGEVQSWASTKAKAAEVAATNAGVVATRAATAAQAAFNLVAKANPYLLLAAAIGAVVGALALLGRKCNETEGPLGDLKRAADETDAAIKRIGENVDFDVAIGEAVGRAKGYLRELRLEAAKARLAAAVQMADEFNSKPDEVTGFNWLMSKFTGDELESESHRAIREQIQSMVDDAQKAVEEAEGDLEKSAETLGAAVSFATDKTQERTQNRINAAISRLKEEMADLPYNSGMYQYYDELVKQLEAELPKTTGGGGGGGHTGKSADEIARERMLNEQAVERQRRNNLLLQEQAIIDLMDDGIDKEIAQMRLNHQKRMNELADEQQDLLNAKITSAGVNSQGQIRSGFYANRQYASINLTDEELLGVNSKRISENQDYLVNVAAMFNTIEKNSASAQERMQQLRLAYASIMSDIEEQERNNNGGNESELLVKMRVIIDEQYQQSQKAIYDELLSQYQNFEQRRVELAKQYNDDIQVLQSQHPTDDAGLAAQKAALEERKRQYEAALQSINNEEYSTMQKSSQLLVDLFSNAADMSNKKIREVIANTQLLLTYISTAKDSNGNAQVKDSKGNVTKTITQQQIVDLGFTPESIQVLEQSPEKIKTIQDAIQRLQQQATKNNPFARLAEDIQSLFSKEDKDGKTKKSMKDLAKDAAACADVIGGLAGQLADMFNSIGDTETADAFSSVQDMMSTVSNIGKGFAEGGLVGGIAAAAGEAINYVGKALQANQRHKEALKKIMQEVEAEQRAYNMLILQQNLAYEEAATIFGTMSWEKAKRAVEVMKDAYAKLNEEIYGEGGHKQRTGLFTFEWINDAYQGLRDIEIKTGHKKTGLFGWGSGKDIYSSVLDVYPDLIDAEGKLNVKRAEAIIQTREMSQEDKDALQSMIDYANMAEEAWQQVHDYFTDIFGSFGDTLTDALVEGFENGTSAAKDFTDSVGDMLEKLAKQMVFSILFSELIENAQAAMEEVTKNGDLTDQQKFDQYAAIISDLTNNVIARESQADAMLQQFKDAAAKNGLSIFDNTSDQQADKKGFAAMSQDTGEELNGRFTALQIAGENLSAQMNAVAPVIVSIGNNTAEIKDMVDGIGNVADDMLTNIVECYTELNLIRVNTDDMYSIMKSNKTTLEKIEKNTKNI